MADAGVTIAGFNKDLEKMGHRMDRVKLVDGTYKVFARKI